MGLSSSNRSKALDRKGRKENRHRKGRKEPRLSDLGSAGICHAPPGKFFYSDCQWLSRINLRAGARAIGFWNIREPVSPRMKGRPSNGPAGLSWLAPSVWLT